LHFALIPLGRLSASIDDATVVALIDLAACLSHISVSTPFICEGLERSCMKTCGRDSRR